MKGNAHEAKGKHNEIYFVKQKNVGVNAMEIAALNKRGPVGEGLELLRGTQETGTQNKTKPLEKAWN